MFEKKPKIVNLSTIEDVCNPKKESVQPSSIVSFSNKLTESNITKDKKIVPKKAEINKNVNTDDSGDDILWF